MAAAAFKNQSFIDDAGKLLVLCEQDQPKAGATQDVKDSLKKYGINAFPTLLITDEEGNPLTRVFTHGGKKEKEILNDILDAEKRAREAKKAIDGAKDAENAKDKEQILKTAPAYLRAIGVSPEFETYKTKVKTLLEMEKNNEHGMQSAYLAGKLSALGYIYGRNADAVLADADALLGLENVAAEDKALASACKAYALLNKGKSEEALAAIEGAKELKTLFGQPFNYDGAVKTFQGGKK